MDTIHGELHSYNDGVNILNPEVMVSTSVQPSYLLKSDDISLPRANDAIIARYGIRKEAWDSIKHLKASLHAHTRSLSGVKVLELLFTDNSGTVKV